MVFSKKLAGAIAVAAALAVTPGASAAPTGPGDGPTGGTVISIQPMAACSFYWDAAMLASNLYWASTHGGPPLTRDDYNDLWASYQAAVAEYERRSCWLFMGPPPAWGVRP